MPGDEPYARMRMVTPDGVELVEVRDYEEAKLISDHSNAVQRYLHTGDHEPLSFFTGQTVAGKNFLTDPGYIEEWARRGEISFEDIYE